MRFEPESRTREPQMTGMARMKNSMEWNLSRTVQFRTCGWKPFPIRVIREIRGPTLGVRGEQRSKKEPGWGSNLRSLRLLLCGGPVAEALCRLTEISRSGERATGFGGEPMPCVRQSPRALTHCIAAACSGGRRDCCAEKGRAERLFTFPVILTRFPVSTQ